MNSNSDTSWAFSPTTSLPTVFSIPQSHITLLDTFFRVVDHSASDPSASQQFASVFTSDGIWKTPSATISGIQQLIGCGDTYDFFKMIKSMRHWVLRVYVNDVEGRELMLLGTVRSEMSDGTVLEQQFGARVEIDGGDVADDNAPKLKFFQGWSSRQ